MGTSVRSSSLHQTIFIDTDDLHSICPGRHFAEADLWLAMACALAVFDILPVEDESGRRALPKVDFVPGSNT